MKRTKIALAVLILTCLLVYFVPVNRTINEKYLCNVLDQKNKVFHGEATVILTGAYSDYLLRRDKFVGRIDIEGFEFFDAKADDCTFYIKNHYANWIHEYVYHAGSIESNILGTFYATEDFDSFFLWAMVPNDPDAGYSGGAYGRYFITHPEMTFEEIYFIIDKNNA